VLLLILALQAQSIPPLPDSSGWGVHVLAIARAPDSAIWVGTYGQGIFVLRQGAERWERIRSSSDTAAHAISWDFVHAFGFGPKGQVWYGTVAEAGALTVAIRHDRRLTTLRLFSVYYHNSKLLVEPGQRVKQGDVIALVGNTGRATNDHMHLEVHASPYDLPRYVVDPAVRYPPYNTNPELWIEPLPGTGIVAGQVWDSAGRPVQQARIYGLVKPEPQETPFSFIETYGSRNHSDPDDLEHFAISDVPSGEYVLGVEIGGKRVFRRVKVEAGKLTWVEFRPDAH
jgi:hypothetical protein